MAELAVRLEGLNETISAFEQVGKIFRDPTTRREIALAAAPIVISAIQSSSPVGKKIHKRYNTPKLINSLRAPKGFGRVAATYLPGNLRNAVIDLATRRRKYKKSPAVVVAPLYARSKGKGPFGQGKRVDAYYAHMVYGSAEAYQKRVLLSGLQSSQGAAIQAMFSEVDKKILEAKQKTGL